MNSRLLANTLRRPKRPPSLLGWLCKYGDSWPVLAGVGVVIVVVLVLTGCVKQTNPGRVEIAPSSTGDTAGVGSVQRVTDPQTGVACYYRAAYEGISCVKVAGGAP